MPSTRIQLDGTSLPEFETLVDSDSHEGSLSEQGDWSIGFGQFWGGLSANVEILELNNGRMSVYVLPTRGMGIWRAECDGVPIGWQSPVKGPVHPAFVNLQNRNGLGWLDGFDELVARCGLAFNGPPGHDDGAASPIESDITLHGRVANLAARDLEAIVDEEQSLLGVSGTVDEKTLFGPQFEMRSTTWTRPGSTTFSIRDEITNVGSRPTELELIYHNNFGKPFLSEGSVLECPTRRVVPRDARAAENIRNYQTYLGPTPGYTEQAYFFDLIADDDGETVALLRNQAADSGIAVRFQTSQLPCFCVWKCTQDEAAGYVTGLEPGTNFPNFKAFERHHGRVRIIEPGETYLAEIHFDVLGSAEAVGEVHERISRLQGQFDVQLDSQPVAPYCPID
ncbi:MAG: aldose 1-epimerase family protein [Planctomycetaceae bacterium]|nr:aldose 1-epimerase family protein [Planctomycetaceae bacterium]